MLRTLARQGLDRVDDWFAAMGHGATPAGGCLISVLFHSLYRDRTQVDDDALAPNQNVTVEDFRAFVEAILAMGYTAVSPAQVDAGLAPGGRYVMITFDDGYFNNTLALDVLAAYQVPATFFISTGHVLQNKGFWWDAFSRQLARSGMSPRDRHLEIHAIKTLTSSGIEERLRTRFGNSVFRPQGDLDRPFTKPELQDFARNRWVHLGNHTRDHAILTRCTGDEMAREINACQAALKDITGEAPIVIAYPNGNHSDKVVHAAMKSGLRLGLTVRPFLNRLPLPPGEARMTLGRFLYWGGRDAKAQCRRFSTPFIPGHAIRSLLLARD